MITIAGRAVGKKRKLFDDFSVPLPPSEGGGGGPDTLRQLITRIVLFEVAAFRDRQEKRRLEIVLSPKQIDAGLQRGEIDSGGRELNQSVEDDHAVGTALQAFEDGLYLVIIDAREYRNLDEIIYLQPDSTVTFVRLVFLAGA